MSAKHQFYKTGDTDAPLAIRDSRGEVVLHMCRVCGQAEAELTSIYCHPAMPPALEGKKIDAMMHFTPNTNVPPGVAVVTHENRVLFLGPANQVPDHPHKDKWPDGTVINLHPRVYRQLADALAAKREAGEA